ncbi:MAG: hypothetical protein EXS05_14235 [Planctomycetaceae bacterium]|nr:hypothetical protein [Planctomycetaceae bacterium]
MPPSLSVPGRTGRLPTGSESLRRAPLPAGADLPRTATAILPMSAQRGFVAIGQPDAHEEFEIWDDGRLHIHPRFASLLRANGLTSCDAFFNYEGGELVRRVGTRETRRLTLEPPACGLADTPADGAVLYLKRHGPPRWRDRIMPWLHFSRPIHGARNEWEAIGLFAAAGISTMTPVAFGEAGPRSLLVTEALPAKCNLLEWVAAHAQCQAQCQTQCGAVSNQSGVAGLTCPTLGHVGPRDLIEEVAEIARRMHSAGLHHQDFYLNHLLLCDRDGRPDIRVIDLGRVRQQSNLGKRWIIKDLSQLDFSAAGFDCVNRLRFLRLYLGRPFTTDDRRTVRKIMAKSKRIASHTKKHRL